ncbi:MAG TPA: tripartite tricarboxylate transporter substrate-binding protein, partial [Afipia sp.]
TPAAIVEKLNQAVNEGLKSEEVRESVAKLGMEVKIGSVQDFDAALGEQIIAWKSIVDSAGIKVE